MQFQAELEEIFTGAQGGAANRWTGCNFFDKVLFATSSVEPQYWPGGGNARPIPGLPAGVGWDGIEVVAGHPVVWKGETIKWADIHDFTNWIPVGTTAVSLRATTLTSFRHPSAGFATDWIHLDEDGAAFVEGQYVRVDIDDNDPTQANYHFYTVEEVSSPLGVGADSIGVSQSVPASSTGTRIFTMAYSAWGEGSRLLLNDRSANLEVVANSRDLTGTFTSNLESDPVPPIGGTFRIRVAENPSSLKVGDVLSVGATAGPGLDLYEVVTVAFYLELRRLNVGTQRAATNFRYASGTYLTFQPFVEVKNLRAAAKTIPASSDLTAQLAVKLLGLGLSGERAVDSTISAGVDIQSLDANEAGEVVNAGSQINGEVFAVVSLGEYGIVLKERSIGSMQYVGRQSGTFFFRPEILDEGPIAKHAWTRLADKQLVFVGHKYLYSYAGGQVLEPIATQHTQEMFKTLDRSRASEIVLYHKEESTELWVHYPTLEAEELKVLVWNYRFNTVVEDSYSQSLGSFTAFGGIDWEIAPTWASLPDTLYWEDETRRWREMVDEGLRRHTILAVGADASSPAIGEPANTTVPRLLLHGRKFSRASADNCLEASMTCLAETSDYDFGDPARWKHADTLQIDLEVDEHLTRPLYLQVQLGSRSSLDSDIKWSSPSRIEVSGNGSVTTKVNIRAAGRYLRIRFFSNQIGSQWRVAGFRLIARPGGTY